MHVGAEMWVEAPNLFPACCLQYRTIPIGSTAKLRVGHMLRHMRNP